MFEKSFFPSPQQVNKNEIGKMLTGFDAVLTMKRFKPPHTDTNTHLPNDPLNFKAEPAGFQAAWRGCAELHST